MAGSDESRSSICEGCGTSSFKVKRVHKQQKFCSTCYARLFKRRPCPQCASMARLPTFDLKAICQRCLSTRPCVRCGRSGRRVGRMTVYGPACDACAHYFTQPQSCEICQVYSTRLTLVVADDRRVKACPKCARSGFETCALCRRYRQLILHADGRKLCRRCSTMGLVSCSCCGADSPAGRGGECIDCYWQHTYRKRLAMDVEAFSSSRMREEFQRFGEWLPSRTSYKKAACSINRYLLFFQEIESQCPCSPSYVDLLAHFGAETLRCMRLPMAWFICSRGIVVDVQAREMDSERRRIAALLASCDDGQRSDALNGYYCLLMGRMRTGQTSLRSVRLALSTAARLLTDVCQDKGELPDTIDISQFLKRAPGRMASLTGFIHYLNLRFGMEIDIQHLQHKAKLFGKRNLENELFDLLRRSCTGEDVTERWVLVGLRYFYRLARHNMTGMTVHPDASGEGIQVSIEHRSYWLPSPHDAMQHSTEGF